MSDIVTKITERITYLEETLALVRNPVRVAIQDGGVRLIPGKRVDKNMVFEDFLEKECRKGLKHGPDAFHLIGSFESRLNRIGDECVRSSVGQTVNSEIVARMIALRDDPVYEGMFSRDFGDCVKALKEWLGDKDKASEVQWRRISKLLLAMVRGLIWCQPKTWKIIRGEYQWPCFYDGIDTMAKVLSDESRVGRWCWKRLRDCREMLYAIDQKDGECEGLVEELGESFVDLTLSESKGGSGCGESQVMTDSHGGTGSARTGEIVIEGKEYVVTEFCFPPGCSTRMMGTYWTAEDGSEIHSFYTRKGAKGPSIRSHTIQVPTTWSWENPTWGWEMVEAEGVGKGEGEKTTLDDSVV